MRMDLTQKSALADDPATGSAPTPPIQYHYYPDAPSNPYIEAARRLPQVQDVLWFDRFPVTRFHKEGNEAVVEILDLRFARLTADRPPAFTYRICFGSEMQVLSQGWVRK